MDHTSDASEPINAVAPEDDGPTWDMPGHRRSSELTGGSVVGLVLRATELFAAFAGDAEGAMDTVPGQASLPVITRGFAVGRFVLDETPQRRFSIRLV